MSVASSQPASQLLQSQTNDSQSTAVAEHPITPARSAIFRQTLGSLMGSRVFTDGDTCNVDVLIDAVNTVVRASPSLGATQVFARPEAIQALRAMNDDNLLMYVLPTTFFWFCSVVNCFL